MENYENIAALYDKWLSTDPAYLGSGPFYVSALSQMKSGKYLELAVGTGRISLEAIRHAPISMTGIDISEQMLSVCKERYDALSEKQGTLSLCKGDVTQLAYHEEFEGAIMPYHTIVHMLTEEAAGSLFAGVYSALKRGGWFLMDDFSLNLENIPWWANTDKPIIEYQDSEITISDHFQCDYETNLMNVKAYVNDKLFEDFQIHWRKPDEIETLAKQAGFVVLSLMGDFDCSAWTKQSPEQIWLFRKPGNSESDIQMPQFAEC